MMLPCVLPVGRWMAAAVVLGLVTAGSAADQSNVTLTPKPGLYTAPVPVEAHTRPALPRRDQGGRHERQDDERGEGHHGRDHKRDRLVYSVDGTQPTAATGWAVDGPIWLTDDTTLRVARLAADGVLQAEVRGDYRVRFPLTTARPVFSPAAGAYIGAQAVALSCPTPGAIVLYTLDGSEPTCGSPRYTAPLAIAQTTTVRARAFGGKVRVVVWGFPLWLPALAPSGVATAVYHIQGGTPVVATPVVTPAAGTFTAPFQAQVSVATAGAVARYRLDGSDPTTADPVVPADGVAIDRSATLAVRAFKDGSTPSPVVRTTYVMQVQPASASLASGTYVGAQQVTLTSPTADSVVRYALDGSDPTAASPSASGAITLPGSCTLVAAAWKDGWTASATAAWTYVLQVPAPALSPAPAPLPGDQPVTVQVAGVGLARYTLDGTAPQASSPVVPLAGVLLDRNATLTVAGFQDGWLPSVPVAATYRFQPQAPALSLAAGSYVGDQTVTLTCPTPATVLRYTLDGTAPTAASPSASGAVVLPGSCILTALAQRDGWLDSVPTTAAYALRLPSLAIQPVGGVLAEEPLIQVTGLLTGAAAHYTLDGSQPTDASPLLPATGLPLDRSATVTVVATKAGWEPAAPATAAFELVVRPPVLDRAAGVYNDVVTVTPTCPTTSAVILLTRDGSDPATASTAETATGAITVERSQTLTLRARRAGWTDSPAVTAAYVLTVAAPVASVPAGTYTTDQSITLTSLSPGVVIRYTLDGSAPTASSPVATGAVVIDRSATLTAVAERDGWTPSASLVAAYVMQVAEPAWQTAPAPATASAIVQAVTATPGARLVYTLDGSVPTADALELPVTLTRTSPVTVMAIREGWTSSAPLSAVWTVVPTVGFTQSAITATVAGGAVTVPIRLSDVTDHDVTVAVVGVSGTAVAGTDFTVSPATVTIAAGATEAAVNIQALAGAADDRPTVTGQVVCVEPQGAALGAIAAATITIPGAAGPPPVFTTTHSPLKRVPAQPFDRVRWETDAAYRSAFIAGVASDMLRGFLASDDQGPVLVLHGSSRTVAQPGSAIQIKISGNGVLPVICLLSDPGIVQLPGGLDVGAYETDGSGTLVVPLHVVGVGVARIALGSPGCRNVVYAVVEGSK